KEVIEQRLSGLTPPCRDVLEVASVLGREFQVDLVERLSGVDAPFVLALLDEAEAARIIADAPGLPGRQRVTHALVRDTLYGALPRAGRLGPPGLAGETSEPSAAGGPTAHLSEVAHPFMHALPAVDPRDAIEWAERPGAAARRLLAHEEAARL